MYDDVTFLGLAAGEEPGHFSVTVADRLARIDGQLYGGAAIAISVAAAEQRTERSALWMTTQYVSTVATGVTVAVTTEVLAAGRRTNQVRVTGTATDGPTAGQVVWASLGATGHHRPDGLTGEFERRPTVAPPEESERWVTPFSGLAKAVGLPDLPEEVGRRGFGGAVEVRQPEVHEHPEPGPGRWCLWLRRRDGARVSPAVAAYLADMVPMSVAQALGVVAGGTSLDNTIRLGRFVDTEWVLIDLRPHLAVGGYGHGVAHVWSRDGHLLATASQTASMIEFDPALLFGPGAADELVERPDG